MENAIMDNASGLERQREYLAQQAATGAEEILIVESAFVNGIRDLGYRSTATALDELIDNAMQAGARRIDVALGFQSKSDKKPTSIAVIDDGHGMLDGMLAYSVKWGGTDRENDRRGFGRYGYGLPSSCVSQGERFQVFSRTQGGDFYGICVDLQEIRAGKYTGANGRIMAPKATQLEPPAWVIEHLEKHFSGLPHGTVVLLDKFDRLTWTTRDGLRKNLMEHFGVVYRRFLRNTTIFVDEKKVDPIDPLFLTPGARFYDLDSDRAQSRDDITVDVKGEDGRTIKGTIRIRISYLPPTFGYIDKTLQSSKQNERMSIMRQHEGIIVMRNGRQMDVLSRARWKNGLSFRNIDRYWQIELDFPALLDEQFRVTTSKQGVTLSDRIWELLRQADLDKIIGDLQTLHDEQNDAVKKAHERQPEAVRPSETALQSAESYFASEEVPLNAEQTAQAEENFETEVQRKASESGMPVDQVREALQLEIQRRPVALIEVSEPGNVFYRPERVGAQRRVYLNTKHPFYKELYAGPTSSPEIRHALDVLILVLAAGEFDARDQRLEFYENERGWWSNRLKTSLRELRKAMPPVETRADVDPDAVEDGGAELAVV